MNGIGMEMQRYQPLEVVLDDGANIVSYYDPQNILGYGVENTSLIGQDWFSIFIDPSQYDEVMAYFKRFRDSDLQVESAFNNDLLSKKGSRLYIDFYNTKILQDGKKLIKSYGFEHFANEMKRFIENR